VSGCLALYARAAHACCTRLRAARAAAHGLCGVVYPCLCRGLFVADSRRWLHAHTCRYLVRWGTLPWLECTWELEKDVNDDLKIAQFHRVNLPPSDPVPNIDVALRPTLTSLNARKSSSSAPRTQRPRRRRQVVRRLLPRRTSLRTAGAPPPRHERARYVSAPVPPGRPGRPAMALATGILQRAFLATVIKLDYRQKCVLARGGGGGGVCMFVCVHVWKYVCLV